MSANNADRVPTYRMFENLRNFGFADLIKPKVDSSAVDKFILESEDGSPVEDGVQKVVIFVDQTMYKSSVTKTNRDELMEELLKIHMSTSSDADMAPSSRAEASFVDSLIHAVQTERGEKREAVVSDVATCFAEIFPESSLICVTIHDVEHAPIGKLVYTAWPIIAPESTGSD